MEDDDLSHSLNGQSHVTKDTLNLKLNKIAAKVTETAQDLKSLIYRNDASREKEELPAGIVVIYSLMVGLILLNTVMGIIHYI